MAKILLVDDDEDVVRLVAAALADEHEVCTAVGWSEVSSKLFTRPDIDLILMDVDMPVLDGGRLTGIIRRNSSDPFKIVLFSAMDVSELRQRARAVGADGYIPKTLDRRVLRSRVARFLA